MHASTGSRKRTRSEWAEHYKDLHNKIKAKKLSEPATVGVKNVVDCESAIEDDSVASMDRFVTKGYKKIDLGEQVVSNGSGLGSSAGNSKDSFHVLAISSDDSADPGNSSANTDGSDESDPEYDDFSDDAEDDGLSDDAKDDDFSDEDYEAEEQLTSDDSKDSYYNEQETEDENDGALKGEVISNIIDKKKTLCTHGESDRMLYEKKEINTEHKVDDEPEPGNFSSPFPKSGEVAPYKSHKSNSLGDSDGSQIEWEQQSCQHYLKKLMMLGKKNTCTRKNYLTKNLVDSINSLKEKQCPIQENDLTQGTLPLRFRFEDEVQPPIAKSEWEKEMDSLFCDQELGHRESEIEFSSICPVHLPNYLFLYLVIFSK